jgi:hypothetical protein
MSLRRFSRSLVLLPLVLVACRDQEITTYRVAKDTPAPAPAAAPTAPAAPAAAPMAAPAGGGSMASTPVATAAGASLAWTAPAAWQSKPGSAMRKATYVITGEGGVSAELAVTAFPGDVGGEVANVNRWRGQLQLAPQSPTEAAAALTRVQANGLAIGVVEMVGTGATPVRLIGAMVPFDGSTWFFKLTGPDALVAGQKQAFLEFARSIRPAK